MKWVSVWGDWAAGHTHTSTSAPKNYARTRRSISGGGTRSSPGKRATSSATCTSRPNSCVTYISMCTCMGVLHVIPCLHTTTCDGRSRCPPQRPIDSRPTHPPTFSINSSAGTSTLRRRKGGCASAAATSWPSRSRLTRPRSSRQNWANSAGVMSASSSSVPPALVLSVLLLSPSSPSVAAAASDARHRSGGRRCCCCHPHPHATEHGDRAHASRGCPLLLAVGAAAGDDAADDGGRTHPTTYAPVPLAVAVAAAVASPSSSASSRSRSSTRVPWVRSKTQRWPPRFCSRRLHPRRCCEDGSGTRAVILGAAAGAFELEIWPARRVVCVVCASSDITILGVSCCVD